MWDPCTNFLFIWWNSSRSIFEILEAYWYPALLNFQDNHFVLYFKHFISKSLNFPLTPTYLWQNVCSNIKERKLKTFSGFIKDFMFQMFHGAQWSTLQLEFLPRHWPTHQSTLLSSKHGCIFIQLQTFCCTFVKISSKGMLLFQWQERIVEWKSKYLPIFKKHTLSHQIHILSRI